MDTYSRIEEKIFLDLQQAGWQSSEILKRQKVAINGRLVEIDFMLIYNLLPVAIVEVKSPGYDTDEATFQVWEYTEMVDVPFGLVSDGNGVVKINRSGNTNQLSKFPSPEALLKEAGVTWIENDPLLFPPLTSGKTEPKFHQAKAISNAIKSLKHHKRTAVILPTGTGKSYVALQVIWKLIKSNFFNRALIICDRLKAVSDLERLFVGAAEEIAIGMGDENDLLGITLKPKIVIETYQSVLFNDAIPDAQKDFDFIVIFGDFSSKVIRDLSDNLSQPAILLISGSEKAMRLSKDFEVSFRYSVEDVILAEDARIPEGYKSVPLESVSEIIYTHAGKVESVGGDEQEVLTLSGRSITDDGKVDLTEIRKLFFDKKRRLVPIQPNDILVARISSHKVRLGIIPEDFKKELYTSHSLILIRVNSALVKPLDVFAFLISPAGQTNLLRYASVVNTSVNQISLPQLGKMPILIPDVGRSFVKEKPPELNLSAQVKEEIEKDILPILDRVAQSDQQNQEQPPEFEYVAEKLRSLAIRLSPPKLNEKVLNQYPMPIAMSYRRFLDSKFNVFEQVFRLRDLFESIGLFTYNVMLADYLRRIDYSNYKIKDSGVRKAYNGYSMAKRIDFLNEILQTALQREEKDDLFIPELCEAQIVPLLRDMGEFRNLISHTAVPTERRQKRLIEKYEPKVMNLLQEMEFITSYRLARIPEFRFLNGRLIHRMEVYAGVVPQLEEIQVDVENEYIRAESDHLVLLDQEDQVLDLYPFYQLVESEETHDETHMCFLKYRQSEQKRLTGESVQGSFEVTLDGYDFFEELQKRINQ